MGNMGADQRREAIAAMLTADPMRSQQSIGAELGISQSQVQRYVADLRRRGVLPPGNSSKRGRPTGTGTVVELHVDSRSTSGTSAGEDLVARLRAELDAKGLEPDAREEGLLLQIRQVADEIAELRDRIGAEGLTFKPATPGGPPRLHPAAAEIRGNRSLLGRLLQQISLEESVRNPVKQKAANVRWRQRQMAAAQQAEGGGRGQP
ncbi:hypothetical protein [Mycobacterium sp.]|uniref:hypothetical protein n=1 Tax=Mycobacterium sp. TaxID=1785 RepID=UPI003F9D60AE